MKSKIQLAVLVFGCVSLNPTLGISQDPAPPNPQEQIKQLVEKISQDLQEIDKLLLEAADANKNSPGGGAGAKPPESGGSEKTNAGGNNKSGGSVTNDSEAKAGAREAQKMQRQVAKDIQQIIDLIPPGGGSSGGGGGGGKGKGNNGKNKGSSGGGKGEQNPEDTRKGDGKDPNESQGGGKDPNDPSKSMDPPEMGKSPYKDYETEHRQRTDGADRWGELPEHARKAFSSESTDDVPLRYRKWIQDFYRRVQKPGATPNK